MGFDELEFNDRYLRVPLYYQAICWLAKLSSTCTNSPFQSKPTANTLSHIYLPYNKLAANTPFNTTYPQIDSLAREQSDPLKRGFASFVASNPNAPIRNAFYQELNTYKPVAGGGGV
ncbi:ALPHA (1,3)-FUCOSYLTRANSFERASE [Helicobacter ailurogastricus]|uniref:ALPHA (1,3)-FUCOSYLTRANSFERASE n=1 Tax=Helicobacter ailurogastricus TaxID=1578720 RepID=A0A0K2XB42_9HELI|nr:ALPHA (1,3)-FUCOSYLTRANSFERASE [Helicobacter ailurogastricus]